MIISELTAKASACILPSALHRQIYRGHEFLLGRPTFPYLAELEKTQYLSRNQLEALQLQRLKQLLQSAEAHCPWHGQRMQAAGIDPKDLTWDKFRQLPLMTKQDARQHGREIVWRHAPGGIFPYNTGGSTGEPLIFYFGRKRQAADAACRIRARRWWGVDVGDREAFLWGAPTELNRTDWIKSLRDRLCNQRLFNAFAMSPQHMDRYLDELERFRPKTLYGYASSLSLLAEHSERRGRIPDLSSLKVIYTTGEPLYPHQRELIGRIFNAPVANEYGARDAGLIALESPTGQMLINSEWILVEILDDRGNPVPEGELGEVVITNLASEVQPFIRYRTGDRARRSRESCRQARGLEVLDEVEGRSTDLIVRSDGTVMHALALIYVLRETPGVKQFKIVQTDFKHLLVLMVTEPRSWKQENATRIQNKLKQRLGENTTITLKYTDYISPEKSGKYRYVVSQVSGETAI
ncbi:phenylacetate--CoA ligase family protein [Methylohalobius crimeensis]|uniref:phenylacetate--CoA ligase family protein n=1 Tax=Methylohalobius crimeensis TaxID=244365 RepID=UPI0003B3806F|nr:AMP-binding protein [Methylohalobius crimeensis]